MKSKIKSPEYTDFTFETKDQLAEFMRLPSSSSVVSALWDDLKANKTTDQAIVNTVREAARG